MNSKLTKTAGIIVAVLLIIIGFAGVRSSQKDKSNRVINREQTDTMDVYLPNEVMSTWYGQVGLTNVEEYGANGGKVAAKIHYKNTTGVTMELAPSDFGAFLDEKYYYSVQGVKDKVERYEDGESAEFEVFIKRKEGLDGLYYVLKEPEKEDLVSANTESPYIAGIDLSLLSDDNDFKRELYGYGEDYSEKSYKDSVGKKESYVNAISTIEDIILFEDRDNVLAEERKEEREKLEEQRQKALESLN